MIHTLEKEKKRKKKLGPFIAIIGPEGAGKSTTVAALKEHLQKQGEEVQVVFFGRGAKHILPIPHFKKKDDSTISSKSTTSSNSLPENLLLPQNSRKENLLKKMLYSGVSVVYTLDFLLRYLFYVLPKRFQGSTVIADRYVSDIYNMQHVPKLIRRASLSLFPRPTVTFYLYNSLSILYQRKGRNLQDLAWQLQNADFLVDWLEAKKIKTNNKEETMQDILQHLAIKL